MILVLVLAGCSYREKKCEEAQNDLVACRNSNNCSSYKIRQLTNKITRHCYDKPLK